MCFISDILKIKYSSVLLLTVLNEFCLTFRTRNRNLALSLRNTNLLLTSRTLVDMIRFSLFHVRLLLFEETEELILHIYK